MTALWITLAVMVALALLVNNHANHTSVDDFGAGIMVWLLVLLALIDAAVIVIVYLLGGHK